MVGSGTVIERITDWSIFLWSTENNNDELPEPFISYNLRVAMKDRDFVKDCNESIDTMMVFVSG
jgi:hypothetical protein